MMIISNLKSQISNLLRIYSNVTCQMSSVCQKGFTLIELVIVVGILSILSIGALAVLDPASQFQKANDIRRKSDLSQIQKALEIYYDDNGRYPSHFAAADYRIKGLDGIVINWGSSWQPYMDILPKDPKSSKSYVYYAVSDGQSYFLYASLDRGTDPGACNSEDACVSLSFNGISDSACGKICNFGVSSPNVSP